MISEDEVLRAALAQHSPASAEKFIQEVYWRTYWKGWLEQRPSVWTNYRAALNGALNNVQTQAGLRREWEAACSGATGIACFDAWAKELVETGYLHNHARMWFASIWIFTLRLPWELGADFFMRHLLDGDPASNTLGWRWVAGVQTVGKTYLARPDNIAKYTDGRFNPSGLASFAAPLDAPPAPDRTPVRLSDPLPPGKVGVLITEDDLTPDWMLAQLPSKPVAIAAINGAQFRSPLAVAPQVVDFVDAAITDAKTRLGEMTPITSAEGIDAWAAHNGLDAIVMSYTPVGGTADALRGLKTPLHQMVRPYDARAWPYATAGFFKFKAKISTLLKTYDDQLDLF